ncbi:MULTISPECIES: DapH/DapD/GlmU-related protein [Serratia]|uniref:DapH/DapD/GlmU-related protein n=1 Tax=Serratia TaxID=613 RepID=UPI0009E2E0F8|nr:DapH/DapD/GlmU-related protein [Serratia sp. 506_PEND]
MRYYFYLLKKSIKPHYARLFFNTSFLSNNKRKRILEKCGVKLSSQSHIATPFYFEYGNINLTGNVLINANCNFLDNERITIQSGAMIGPNVTLTTVSHHANPALRHSTNIIAPINIGENVWIGAGAVILPGVRIGNNSIIAANSVVTSDVPANVLYAGAPAKFKKYI